MLVPGATLAALTAVGGVAALRSAGGGLREWAPAIAVLAAVAGCLLGALAVAHVAAAVAGSRTGSAR